MTEEQKERFEEYLMEVIDPELNVDIVNLGLVYDYELNEQGVLTVTMTLTSIGCPMAGQIIKSVKDTLLEASDVNDVVVNIVWNPPWTKDNMTRYAKIALGIRD